MTPHVCVLVVAVVVELTLHVGADEVSIKLLSIDRPDDGRSRDEVIVAIPQACAVATPRPTVLRVEEEGAGVLSRKKVQWYG